MAQARSTAEQVNNSKWFDVLVRVGLVSYGIVHLLIGWLALQLALGDSSGSASQQGALRQLAQEPYGEVLLWLIALGLLALAVWKAIEAIWGHQSQDGSKRTLKRMGSAGKTILYLLLAVSAAKTAMGQQSKSSQDSTTSKLMDLPFGRFLVLAVGLAIIGVGVALILKGVKKKFLRDLDSRATSGSTGSVIEKLGQVGYIAKGVSLGTVGGLFVWAAWTYDADKAGGLDVALHTLLGTGLGPWLLVLVALGIICFGAYCFARAKYADTQT
ncbi:MAG: DUF1206 domain-containing protein [Propionibacteriales bacterium]|nr:DUF1206 domain-containing protein [Propionibacteriales bacterium]